MQKRLEKWFTSRSKHDECQPYETCDTCFSDVVLTNDIGPYKKGKKLSAAFYNWKTRLLTLCESPDKKTEVTLGAL
jgi:hypothetical protein